MEIKQSMAMDEFQKAIIAAVNKYQRAEMSERIKRGLAMKKQRGELIYKRKST